MAKTKEKKPEVKSATNAATDSAKLEKSMLKKSSFLLPLSLLIVTLAVSIGKFGHQELREYASTLTNEVTRATTSLVTGDIPSKYKSDLISIQVRELLSDEHCVDNTYIAEPIDGGKIIPVTEAMDVAAASTDKVFFMLNGRNEGVYVSWNGDFNCIARAANVAAIWLGADLDVLENGVRLYTQMGLPIRNAKELAESKNLVHILLDFQLWQWPGIKKGYKYTLENGVTLTMVGESPKVFDVEYFLTQAEADEVIAQGSPALDRSKVDGSNSSRVVSQARTSHTAFIADNAFTRDFRKRSAQVARLPSPVYVERLQLVRYAAGEFYRQHLDTFHSREFLPKNYNAYTMDDYKVWANWAAQKLRELDPKLIPEEFKEGGPLFPNAEDIKVFPNALLDVFYHSANSSNLFTSLFDTDWAVWIRSNVDKNSTNLMPEVIKVGKRPEYLPLIVKAWEQKLGRPELHYTFPKGTVNGYSHYFYWVRWAKERIAFLGDQVPPIARPDGELYPKLNVVFQEKLLGLILDDYSPAYLTRMTNDEWYKWMVTNRGKNHVLSEVLKAFPHFAELVIKTWEAHVASPQLLRYKIPKYVKHYHPQRYVTLFLYLNNQTKIGGETVFPYSLDRYSDEKIERTGMSECSTGLAVPPLGLHASLFYAQTPEGTVDKMSRHGGCPPHEGVKWGANSFMWDSDADESADLWTTK